MATALSLITRAAKLLGVVRKGESLDADEAQDSLAALNELLSSWSNHSLVVAARTLEEITIVSSATSYTIAEGATFNTARPLKIESMVLTSGGTDHPIQMVSEKEFERITVKNVIGDSYLATYDNGFPTGTLRFYPLPSAGDTLRLLSEKPLGSIASLNTDVSLPPGYDRALRFNLAVEMAPEYGIEPTQMVLRNAMQSLRNITIAAARNRKIAYCPAEGAERNVYTGYVS